MQATGVTVTGVSPASGTTLGGTAITVTGSNFVAGATVTVGGVAATSVAVTSSSSLTAVTGQHASGATDVLVIAGGHQGALSNAFTFLSPAPTANTPPTVSTLTAQGTRSREPAQFADLGESIPVSGTVQDLETPVSQLAYQWTSTAGGTFTGSGASVTWQAPASAATPLSVTLTLTVTESYSSVDASGLPVTKQNVVTSSIDVSLHDSAKEVGDMGRQFLLDFSDSTIRDTSFILRNFTDSTAICRTGKAAEADDVNANRQNFVIKSGNIGPANVQVNFGTICPFKVAVRGDACAFIPATWVSTFIADGSTQQVSGTGQLTAFYLAADKRWWLCDSLFQ